MGFVGLEKTWIPDGGPPQDGERLENAAKRRWNRSGGGGEIGCGVVTPRSVDDGAFSLATLQGGERTGNKRQGRVGIIEKHMITKELCGMPTA